MHLTLQSLTVSTKVLISDEASRIDILFIMTVNDSVLVNLLPNSCIKLKKKKNSFTLCKCLILVSFMKEKSG